MRFIQRTNSDHKSMIAISRLRRSNEYNLDAVKDALRCLYHGCCTYCEGEVESIAYCEIEHFYPKSFYEKWRMDFHNMHYSCPRCNRLKGDKQIEILSPNYYNEDGIWVKYPEEIDTCLHYTGYKLFVNKNASQSLQIKGNNTINLFQLNNRKSLEMARLRRYAEVYYILKVILGVMQDKDMDAANKDDVLKIMFHQLINYTEPNASYSAMIIQNFGVEICKLLRIWECKRKVKEYKKQS